MKDPLVIEPGELRHSILIQSQNAAQSATGSPQESWQTFRSTYAAIYGIGSREVYRAGQLTSQVSHVVKVRWTADAYQAGQRVLFGSRIFKVQAIVNVSERNRVLMLHCLELDGVN